MNRVQTAECTIIIQKKKSNGKDRKCYVYLQRTREFFLCSLRSLENERKEKVRFYEIKI